MKQKLHAHWMALAFAGISLLWASQAQALTVQEILKMSSQGLSEDVLVTVINSSAELPEMTPENIAILQEANISQQVIDAILQRQQPAEEAQAADTPVDAATPDTTPALPVTSEVMGDNTILAPVESSNLPIIFRKYFKEAYETYTVQAEIARRYDELKKTSDSERASDAELPNVAQYRSQIAQNPIASLESCLAMADEIKPGVDTALGAALNQCIGLALDALKAPAMASVYLDSALQSTSSIPDYSRTFSVFLKNAHEADYTSTNPMRIYAHATEIDSDETQAFLYFISYSLVYGPYPDESLALNLLTQMTGEGVYYARSRILLATLAIRPPEYKFKTAADYLQSALKTLENSKDNTSYELTNQAWLFLARIAFENHAYDMANTFYGKVDINSHHLKDAMIENAWGQLFSGHHAEALAITHALHSPWFKKQWMPDRMLIEASAWLGLCNYRMASSALENLRRTSLEDASHLKAYMAQTPSRDFYNQIIQHAADPQSSGLPERIYYRVISDATFRAFHHTISQLGRERRQLSQYVGPAFTSWPKLQKVYDDAITHRQQFTATILSKIYENTLSELHALDISSSQIAIEIRLAQRRAEVECLQTVASGGKCDFAVPQVSEPATLEKGDNDNYWSFDGEFWRDELHHYVSGVTSMCRGKE